jgi:protein involved in polysaccharide export with SLBB domain
MKLSLSLKIFTLLFASLFSSMAQEIPSEFLSTLNGAQLTNGQRQLILNDYDNYRSNPNFRSDSMYANDANLAISPNRMPTSDAGPVEYSQAFPSQVKLKAKLQVLSQIEIMIEKDIEANRQKFTEEGGHLSKAQKAQLLDHSHDLDKILEEIKGLRLFVVSRHVNEMKSPPLPDLRPFGYDSFNVRATQYGTMPLQSKRNDYSIPFDYKIGSGDFLEIQLYGQKDAQYSLSIGRNGIIKFPEIGPINVLEEGSSFNSLKKLIKEKVGERLGEGVRVAVSLGEPRQIKVFLSGEFNHPGQRLVTAGSSLFSLLLDCGGVNAIASLRSLSLKRKNSSDQVFDLYDLLLKGVRTEAVLQAGDVLFLPTVKNRIWIEGEVLRPAIYEIGTGTTLADAMELAGGLGDRSLLSSISLERKSDLGDSLIVKTLNLKVDESFPLVNGDRVRVHQAGRRNHSAVSLEGLVEFPGKYEWKPGIKISDLLKAKSSYLPDADLNYALIRRESLTGNISFLSFSPNEILHSSDSKMDMTLSRKDRLIVLSRADSAQRERAIRPLLDELRFEGKPGLGVPSVRVSGMVHFPGQYPYTSEMTVGDLIAAGGGMTSSAYTLSSELTSQKFDYNSSNPSVRIIHNNLPSLALSSSLSKRLHPRDVLSIKPIPSWSDEKSIEILGEVQFPGSYTFQKNETLKSVFDRAGGFTDSAFAKGAVFTRVSLVRREEAQKKRLIEQLEKDVANVSLAAGSEQTAVKAKSVADGLLSRLRNTKSVGRLVIDLEEQVESPGERAIVVKNGDKIVIPSIPSEVSVIGEVQFATSHLYNPKLSINDYIKRSGGFTANADEGRLFAVKSNGAVLTKSGNSWFSATQSTALEPGDVIVVPINLEKGKWLETLTSSTQIVYQLAVTAAAVNSF